MRVSELSPLGLIEYLNQRGVTIVIEDSRLRSEYYDIEEQAFIDRHGLKLAIGLHDAQLKKIVELERNIEFMAKHIAGKESVILVLKHALNFTKPLSDNNELLRKARVLCHPDKHDDSALSKSVTQELNRILS
ncbi:MAG: hypothetical protein QX198_17195 [Methylococcaceae bacterium]